MPENNPLFINPSSHRAGTMGMILGNMKSLSLRREQLRARAHAWENAISRFQAALVAIMYNTTRQWPSLLISGRLKHTYAATMNKSKHPTQTLIEGTCVLIYPTDSFVTKLRAGEYQNQTVLLRKHKHYLVIFGFIRQENARRFQGLSRCHYSKDWLQSPTSAPPQRKQADITSEAS